MTPLERQVARGRSRELEFVASPDDLALIVSHVVALLNSGGGTVVIGVDEGGKPLGMSGAAERAAVLGQDLRNAISPKALVSANAEELEGDQVIVVEVPGGRNTPFVSEGRVFLRRGKSTGPATGDDLQQLYQARASDTELWGRRGSPVVQVSDLDTEEINRTVQVAAAERRFTFRSPATPESVLDDLGMRSGGVITNAGDVCFGKSPALRHPQARLRAYAFRSDQTGDDYIDQEDLSGPVAQVVKRALAFVFRNSPLAAQFLPTSVERKNLPPYPEFALKEGVVNALAHRDYASFSSGVTVLVYPDRVEVWNSGRLPNGWTADKLRHTHRSLPRNPDIALFLFVANLMERVGRGTLKMLDACRAAGLPAPTWKVDEDGITLTLHSIASQAAPVARLNDRQTRLLGELKPGQRLRLGEYLRAYAACVTDRQARRDLKELEAADLLRLQGKGRGAFYLRTQRQWQP